jgi:hypothetical protein
MKAYVIHYSKGTQRREALENDPRFKILTDVTWITWYDREEPECEWTRSLCRSTAPKNIISNTLKFCEALRLFVESDQDECLIFEDDVVFQGAWMEKLQKALTDYPQIEILRLDCVTHIKYDGEIKIVSDWWPCEALYMKKEFAKFILRQVSFNQVFDNFLYSLVTKFGIQMVLLPLCNQTSLIEVDRVHVTMNDEILYYNYDDLKAKLLEIKTKKMVLDQKFLEKYGRKVDIRSITYLEENDL